MKKPLKLRRYLVHFSSHNLPQFFTDVLVIGSGVAGLSAALEAANNVSVLLVSKGNLNDGCTNEAQGGIAVALAENDSPEQHYQDTVEVGDGLCDKETVRILTEEAPERVKELMDLGVEFDRSDSKLSFTREGGHSESRILHANGDSTGEAVESVITQRARDGERIAAREDTFAVDLLTLNGTCHGALIWNAERGLMMVRAKQTILATGGCGQIYRETTNPAVTTGDGLAMALRAGAGLQDLEFVQFHPTALYVAGASRALVSESLRGEGAVLRNRDGERFMERYHPDGELAPRDTVSRSIIQEIKRTGDTHVLLDISDKSRQYLEKRFPTITRLCDRFEIDVSKDMIPVRPAAHYQVGGVATDELGRTSLKNLLACGEVACTGVHGANRLGSNSLLEGLVFGRRAGETAAKMCSKMEKAPPLHAIQGLPQEPAYGSLNLTDVRNSLCSLMWRSVGVERNRGNLDEAFDMITFWCRYVMDKEFEEPQGWQLQNMLTVARLITMCARQRQESRGVHYRTDYPETSEHWQRHIVMTKSGEDWL
ncbi:MAG: L-aspartate oxidase [Planctomycetes bacterium]|nr:L-aspartate oxidase [Planctomycetota bacterium]